MDIEPLLYGDAFEPLRAFDVFRQVTVDRELGTIVWPNGADVSPEYLRNAGKSPARPAT